MTSHDSLGYYEILGLTPSATDGEIKQNYRERAKIWHPDHNKSAEALEKFQKLSIAYEVLQDTSRRLFYDLLSQIYNSHNFPDMETLAAYKDRAGQENPFIRTICQQKVIGKVFKSTFRQDYDICSPSEASALVLKTSISNWLLGWWGIKAFVQNIQAITHNYVSINRNANKNLTLLIHNAVAYYKDGKMDKACVSAAQAKIYADNDQKYMLDKFIRLTGFSADKFRYPTWNYARLKLLQLIMPILLGISILLSTTSTIITQADLDKIFAKKKEITYFQTVEYNNGGETYDDVVISKIMNIPVNYNDNSKIFHLKKDVDVKYGPADKFDTLIQLSAGHTIRITGYTPDNKWYRIMIDSGDMGFVRSEMLQKGIGSRIPENSKIISQ